ncbi:MAG: carbonic anhydrase [Acidimicrobiales bacterium]|nr:carbonic anhydrase [Acidimicrobiales bacterium]
MQPVPYVEPATPEVRRQAAGDALRQLLEGNERFAAGGLLDNKHSAQHRAELVDVQHPIAVVIGCVDSRVPPELILGQGVGDLLTVRTAGQSLSGVALGSIEFGVCTLGVPLVVVLGHTNCGAVLAAIGHDHITGHLGELIGEVAARLVDIVGDDPIRATGGNLKATVEALRQLGTLEHGGDPAHVVGVLYDLETGLVAVHDDAGLLAGDRA